MCGKKVGAEYQREKYCQAIIAYASSRDFSRLVDNPIPEYSTLCRLAENYVFTNTFSEDDSSFDVSRLFDEVLPEIESYAVCKIRECKKSLLTAEDSSFFWYLRNQIMGWNQILIGVILLNNCIVSLPMTCESATQLNSLLESIVKTSSKLRTLKVEQFTSTIAKELFSMCRKFLARMSKHRRLFFNLSKYPASQSRKMEAVWVCDNAAHTLKLFDVTNGLFADCSIEALSIIPVNRRKRCSVAYFTCRDVVQSLAEWMDANSQQECTLDAAKGILILQKMFFLFREGQAADLVAAGLLPAIVKATQKFRLSVEFTSESISLILSFCSDSKAHCKEFLDLRIWETICSVASVHCKVEDIATRCYSIMSALLQCLEQRKLTSTRASRSIENVNFYCCLRKGLENYQSNESICAQIIRILCVALEKSSVIDSCFETERLYELMIGCMEKLLEMDGMKIVFMRSLGRMALLSKLIQEQLLEMGIYERVIGIIKGESSLHGHMNLTLTRYAFWAVSCLVQCFPSGQSKLVYCGACGTYTSSVQRILDLPTLVVILNSLSIFVAQNDIVKQALMEENLLQVLLEKKEQLKTIYIVTQSASQKNVLKKLFAMCDNIMEALGHKSAPHSHRFEGGVHNSNEGD